MALFLSDKSRPFQQLQHFAFVDSATSFYPFLQPPILVINIIHFMPSSMLGSRRTLSRSTPSPIYFVEFDDPEVVNITRKPSSIFSASRPIRIISSVFFRSHVSHILCPFYCSPSVSILYYVAHTFVSWQRSPSSTIVACRLSPIYIIFTCSMVSPLIQMVGESNSPEFPGHGSFNETRKMKQKRKIGDCSFHLYFSSISFLPCQCPTLRLGSGWSAVDEVCQISDHS